MVGSGFVVLAGRVRGAIFYSGGSQLSNSLPAAVVCIGAHLRGNSCVWGALPSRLVQQGGGGVAISRCSLSEAFASVQGLLRGLPLRQGFLDVPLTRLECSWWLCVVLFQ